MQVSGLKPGEPTCSQEVWSYWFLPLCQTLSVPPAPCQSTSLHTKQERKPRVKTNLSTPLGPWLELHRVNRGQDTTIRLISPHLQELVCLFKSDQKKKKTQTTKNLSMVTYCNILKSFWKLGQAWCSQVWAHPVTNPVYLSLVTPKAMLKHGVFSGNCPCGGLLPVNSS